MKSIIVIEPSVADHSFDVTDQDSLVCFSAGTPMDEATAKAKEAIDFWYENGD